MSAALVSVIIPAHNAARYIAETLRSVRSQEVPDLEVIVVDDGSTDGTADLALAVDPAIRLIRQERSGVSAARQAGTRAATGRYLKYVDADDLLAPGALAAQVRAIERAGADVVYGPWAYLEQKGTQGGYEQGRLIRRSAEGPMDEAVLQGFWCPTAAYLLRAEALEASGVTWRVEFPIIQDSVFIFDLAAAGLRFQAALEVPVCALYRVRTDSLSRTDRRGFLRDQWAHLEHARASWAGELSRARKEILCGGCVAIAVSCGRIEPDLTERALQVLREIDPAYIPKGWPRLALLARWVGLERAIRWTTSLKRSLDRPNQAR